MTVDFVVEGQSTQLNACAIFDLVFEQFCMYTGAAYQCGT